MAEILLTITGEEPASVSLLTLTRSDTGDTVAGVTLPDDFTDNGSGEWSYEFTAPALGLHYDYTFRLTWDDGTHNDESSSFDDDTQAGEFGTRSGGEKKSGAVNLFSYENLNNGATDDAGTIADVAAAIDDDLVEANTDMKIAWREFTSIALGYSNATEHRWLDDCAEFGLVVKAYNGRNIDSVNTEKVPQQVATALAEWEKRLEMLRLGTVLLDYLDANDIPEVDKVGVFEFVPINRGTSTCDDEFSSN